MPEAPKTEAALYRHWVSFASGEQPFAIVLPDRRLYDTFASWLRGQGPQGYSFPNEGQEMSINFRHVQRMEVEPVRDAGGATRGGAGNPVPLNEPPPLE
jgi:hypothetical protein